MCRVVAVLRGESRVTGEVQFEQTSEDSPTKITYNITGMDPSSKRGFHVQYSTPRPHTTNRLVHSVIIPMDVFLLVFPQ